MSESINHNNIITLEKVNHKHKPEYPTLTPNAEFVLSRRILLRDKQGNVIEDFDGLCKRVSKVVASVTSKTEDEFYDLLRSLDFLPNSPCLVNAGKPGMTLSACYVLPADDSIESIFDTVKHAALIHKQGGGTGVSGAKIRPRGFTVGSTGGIASGPVSLLFQVMNDATEQIKQGSTRRGANMGILPCITGDTMVHTLQGNIPISDLVGLQPYVYACNPKTGKVHVAKAERVFVSGENKKIVRVWFDDDSHLDCTPDHKVLLANGSYREAGRMSATVTVRKERERALRNHRVVRVEELGVAEKVYDLTVPVWHNFVANGVFVHNCWHPDILHFIRYKLEDGKLKNFNISVAVTDKFMQELKDDPDGPHVCNFNGKDFYLNPDASSHEIMSATSVTRRQLWNEIVKNAHKNGEPGLFFIDRANEKNAALVNPKDVDHPGYVHSTNPCQPSWATVLTPNGVSTLEEIKVGDLIWSGKVWTKVTRKKMTGVKPVFAFHTRAGTFYGTENHRVVSNGEKLEVRVAKTIDSGDKENTTYEITKKEHVKDEPVFSIAVEDNDHTYWTGGLLVSNCGEQELSAFDACCLGSINLSNFIHVNGTRGINWKHLESTVQLAVHFLNGVIDLEAHPLNQIKETVRRNRKIGLGVMGYADLLAKLELDYNNEESWKLGEVIAEFIKTTAWNESFKIAKERGKSYTAFDHAAWLRVHPELAEKFMQFETGPINMEVTSVAPTGTISIIAGCSNGIEPIMAWAFVQRRMDTVTTQIHPLTESVLGFNTVVDLRIKAAELYPSNVVGQVGWLNQQLTSQMKSNGNGFVIARDVSVEAHLQHQLAWSKHVDAGISKTINFNPDATEEDITKAYHFAWSNKFKGITVYREGSRNGEVISTGLNEVTGKSGLNGRPTVLPGVIIRSRVEVEPGRYENVYVSVGLKGAKISGGTPYEVFLAGDPKQDPYTAQMIDSVTRMSSTALRYGTPPNVVAQQLERIRSQHVHSMPLRIAQAIHTAMSLSDDIPKNHKEVIDKCNQVIDGNICEGTLIFSEGCYKCEKCLFSKCG